MRSQASEVRQGYFDCIFTGLPNDILRDIYEKAVVLRNDDKKKDAARSVSLEVIGYLKIGCDGKASYTFSSSTERLSILESCHGRVSRGVNRKYVKLSFRHGECMRFYIKNFDGEYKIDHIPTKGADEFGKMVAEYITNEFNCARVLVNKRLNAWERQIKFQLQNKSVEELFKDIKKVHTIFFL